MDGEGELHALAEKAEQNGAGDLAAAIRTLVDNVDDRGEVPDDLVLPFYEEDRANAFMVGVSTGALLEAMSNGESDASNDEGETPSDGNDAADMPQSDASVDAGSHSSGSRP